MRKGRSLERIVAIIEHSLRDRQDVKVESPKRLRDRETGRLREHDVVLTIPSAHISLVVALECRDRSRRVGAPDVEAFKKKCEATGVHHGLIVSSIGFAKEAQIKAAAYGIRCLDLQAAESFDWLLTDSLKFFSHEAKYVSLRFKVKDEKEVAGISAIRGSDGPADLEGLCARARKRIGELAFQVSPGSHRAQFWMPADGLVLIDSRQQEHPIEKVLAIVDFEVRIDVIPFARHVYRAGEEGEQLAEVAVARIDAPGLSGDIAIVRHPDLGGVVSFMPRDRGQP